MILYRRIVIPNLMILIFFAGVILSGQDGHGGISTEKEYSKFEYYDNLNLKFKYQIVEAYEEGFGTVSLARTTDGDIYKYVQGLKVTVDWVSALKETKCELKIEISFRTKDFIDDKIPWSLLGGNRIYYKGKKYKKILTLNISPSEKSSDSFFIDTKVSGEANGIILGVPKRGTPPIINSIKKRIISINCFQKSE